MIHKLGLSTSSLSLSNFFIILSVSKSLYSAIPISVSSTLPLLNAAPDHPNTDTPRLAPVGRPSRPLAQRNLTWLGSPTQPTTSRIWLAS